MKDEELVITVAIDIWIANLEHNVKNNEIMSVNYQKKLLELLKEIKLKRSNVCEEKK